MEDDEEDVLGARGGKADSERAHDLAEPGPRPSADGGCRRTGKRRRATSELLGNNGPKTPFDADQNPRAMAPTA